MFKTSKMTTHAVDYFLDYATRNEPPGKWYGMEEFGQNGELTRESKNEYMNIMSGFHPKEGESRSLVQGAGDKHVPGWDGIFAAPKSFSVAYAIADNDLRAELDAVFRAAVDSSVRYMEEHYVQVRAGSQSKKDYEFQRSKLHGAIFLHHTSRMNDPHIHAHVNIFNVARSLVDGKHRCLDSRVLHKGLKEIGTVFQQELARKLGKMGFECEFKQNNTFEMKGISEEVCKQFSQRGEQIDLKMEATGTAGFKASAHAQKLTRPSKSELSWESLEGDWKREAKKLGFDSGVLQELKKTNKLKLAIPKQSNLKLAKQAIQNVTSTQSTFTRKEVLSEIVRISKGKHTISEIERSVDRALKKHSIELVKDKSHYGIYSTKSILELERGIVNKALKRKKELKHCVRESWLRKYQKNVGKKGGLSREQFEALKHITVESGAVKLVQGYAGTGKSWSLRAAKEVWNRKKLEVVGCALSGKAAQGLEDGSGINSSTIDSLLLKIENEKKFQAKSSRPLQNTLLKENSVLVVDEAGMVDSVKMGKLLDYAHKQKAKVVMVGDTAQLQAIGAGAPFGLLQNHLKTAEIKTIIRQTEEWERQAVTQLAHGEIKDAIKSYEQKGRVHIEETNKDSLKSIVNHYMNERGNRLATSVGNPMKGMLITCGLNENVNQINRLIREELEYKGALGQGIKVKTAQGEKEFAVNDRIVFGKNSEIGGVKVKNGSLGTIKSVSDIFGRNRLMVELDDGKKVKVNADEYTQLDHSYALTVHKAQGVTVDKSYNYLDGFVSTERLYTAQSRGREENHIFASNEVLNVETKQKEERRLEQLDKIIAFTQRDTKLNSVDDLNKIIDNHEIKGKFERLDRSQLLSNLRKYDLSKEIKALQLHVLSKNGLSSKEETMEALSAFKDAVKEKMQGFEGHVDDKKAWTTTFAIANEVEKLNLDIKCFPGIESQEEVSQKLEQGKSKLKQLEVDKSQIEKLGVFSKRKLQWKLDDIQEQISAVTTEISKMEGTLTKLSYSLGEDERLAIGKELDTTTPRRDMHFSRTQQWMNNGLGGVLSELMEKAEGQTFGKEETRLVLASLQERVRNILETEKPGENHKGKAWAVTYQIASELQSEMKCFTGLDAKSKNRVELSPFAWESVRENAKSLAKEEGYFDEQFVRARALRAVQTSGIARLDYRGLHSVSNELMRASYSRHLVYNEKVISGVADAIQDRSVMEREQAEKLAKSSIIDALNMRKTLDKEKGIGQNEGEKEVKTSHSEEGNAYLLDRFKDAVSRPASENAIIPEIKPVQNPGDSTTRFAMTTLGMKSEIKQLYDRVSDTELGKYESWQVVRALTPMVKTSLEKRVPDELYKVGNIQKYATKISIDLVREAAFRAETKVGDFEEKPLKASENIWVSRELSEIERGHSLHKRVAKLASENVEKFSGTATLWNNGARNEVKELLRMSQNGTLSGNQQQLQAIGSLIENYLPPKEYDENHKRLTTIMSEVKEHYHKELMANNPEANAAREYLKGRGFTDEQMKEWKLGLTSEHSLRKLQMEKQWAVVDLKDLGLVKEGKNGRKDYEFFRSRVMIPINNKDGQTVGFGARIYKESDVKRGAPKYLNSPESPIFKKNEILFGQDKAQDSIKRTGEVILTEGYMDAIALQNKGVKNAVAVMGTAFTEKHAQSLETSAKKVVTLFDQDRAGLQAEMRSFAACNKRFDVKTMGLQGVKDPDEYLKKYGVEEFKKQKDRAVDFVSGVAQKVTVAKVDREKLVQTYAKSVLGAIRYEAEKPTAHGLESREYVATLEKAARILRADQASIVRTATEFKPQKESSSYAVWKAKNVVREINVFTQMKKLGDISGRTPSKVIREVDIKPKDLGISAQAAAFIETVRVPQRARVIPGMESEARQQLEKHQHIKEKYVAAVIKEKSIDDKAKVEEVVLVSAKTSYELANKFGSITQERIPPETIKFGSAKVVKDANGEMMSVKVYKNAKERHLELGKLIEEAKFKHHVNGAVVPLSRDIKEMQRQSLERSIGFKP